VVLVADQLRIEWERRRERREIRELEEYAVVLLALRSVGWPPPRLG
jgi:hypothetical protein